MSEPTLIGADTVVSLELQITDQAGNVLEKRSAEQPLTYLHGRGLIPADIEEALGGKTVGHSEVVEVPPERGFGLRDPKRVLVVPLARLATKPKLGETMEGRTVDGQTIPVRVVRVDDKNVVVDGNHPFAGRVLHFDLKVVEVRAATPEELEQGHPDAPQ